MTVSQFKNEFRLVASNSDVWGYAMEAWFECAGRMNKKGMNIPGKWEYRPGLGTDGTDKESYWHSLFAHCSPKQLTTIGNLLFRYCQFLKYKAVDY